MAGLLAIAALTSGCSATEGGANPKEMRGRVIDQDTGGGIAGAIVVGKYMGSRGFEGAASCDRVESAVSDAEGWFVMPLGVTGAPPQMEAYRRGYRLGKPTRAPAPAEYGTYKVFIYQWDDENTLGRPVASEPKTYSSYEVAEKASRVRMDVFMKRERGSREERISELSRMQIAGSCGGWPDTTAGAIPFFEAILAEEIELGAPADDIRDVKEYIESARSRMERRYK